MTAFEVVGKNLKMYRKERGYTQEALANELSMGVCNLRQIEHGKGNPTLQTLIKLANHLHIDVINLFQENNIA